jgi:hypothetical protein
MSVPESAAPELARLHDEWEDVHTELRTLEQRLSEQVALYARGKGARPVELMAEVEHLRTVCSERFQALMTAVRNS